MEKVNSEEVFARIEREIAANPGGAVAFDGDGTLWDGDVAEDFFFTLLQLNDFRAPAMEAMRREAEEFGIDAGGDGAALAGRLFEAHQAGRYPELRCCEMMTWCCAGWRRGEIHEFARHVVRERNLVARLHRPIVGMVEWVRARGVEAILVSASPRSIVDAAAEVVGFGPGQTEAATAAFEGDVMVPRMAGPVPYDGGKMVVLAPRLDKRPLYAAFGDNIYDVAMLRAARVAVTFLPKERLLKRLGEIPGIVELVPTQG
ncbi:HAD family hydrolase [Pendulispora albinea]|uniref:Haloacid dehalogenase-like hydrolase n=1 Tax=Pendulispora albinea TaxID=2741071 RepID=A0ABZ2LVK8_9BACT